MRLVRNSGTVRPFLLFLDFPEQEGLDVRHGVDGRKRPAARRRVPVIWPWVVVVAAWTLALLAVLTNQSYLINHHYLLEQSHLPVLLALVVFLACWQVMTVGMMLPSSMPMIYMMVHASRQQERPRTIQLAFLAGYAVVWTGFAAAAFLGDTLIHQLVHRW